ncbi:MAG: DUF115 domain-containing protein [Desulfobacteraceae bacterium]|nr:MAG: DUF115 domain-containing protein [Desulfobacteraceae bacterium]
MTPYPYLRSNLEGLRKRSSTVHQWLQRQLSSLGPSDRLVQTPNGFLDWQLTEGKSLFGGILPEAIYKEWTVTDHERLGTTIVVGCNLGYGLNRLLSEIPSEHQVVVLEPRADLLLACLGHTDYLQLLESGRLLFLAPEVREVRATLSGLVLPCLFGKILLRVDLPSLQIGPEYALWTDRCMEILRDLKINADTFRKNHDRMILNEMQNLGRASRDLSPAALRGKAEGITGVVMGAGTSLEEFAPALRNYDKQALFSTSFQALPALKRLGLKPHFAMIIDPSIALLKVYEELDAEWASEIPLIYSTAALPEVIRKYPGPKIPVWTATGLAGSFRGGKEPVLDAGGNAALALFRFLRWCGSNRILFVGQDFSWKGTKTHAGGHLTTGQEFRFDPQRHIRTKNRSGEIVFTSQSLLTPLRELERDLESVNGAVFDLYGGGLQIRGSESIGVSDLRGRVFCVDGSERVKKFMQIMKKGLFPAKPFWVGRRSGLAAFLMFARRFLESLQGESAPERKEVVWFLDEVLRQLQADPLRKPYLMKEAFDLSGMIYTCRSFGSQELQRCMEIIDRVERKIREMDRYIERSGFPRPPSDVLDVGGTTRAAA